MYKIIDEDANYYFNDESKLHREDGPALEHISGVHEWWLNGRQYSEDEWKEIKKSLICNHPALSLQVVGYNKIGCYKCGRIVG